jgi:predicted ABC-type ATPase
VNLYFLALDTQDIAIARVATRVAQGGHHIPEATIRRRFDARLENLEAYYKPLVDHWLHYNNSGDEPVLIDWGSK